MFTAQEILDEVNSFIDRLPYDRKPESLYAPIRYVLSMGGKRIRPTLMLLAYNLYKDDPASILMPACALETYHNFTLLHDDLMDRADMRRGKPTAHKKWGDNAAVLSGDAMLVQAYERMVQVPDDKIRPVMELFNNTSLEICEGQQLDMEFETRTDVTEDEYIEMIRLKTSVLLACALKMGSVLADSPCADADNLYHFGEKIGLAFQLQDDYLDVYGDPAVFGKAIGGDIISNKKTYMLINAWNMADHDQRTELEHWITADKFDAQEKIAAVTRLYNEIGVNRLAENKITEYFEESRKYLAAISVEPERKRVLTAYTDAMMKRKK